MNIKAKVDHYKSNNIFVLHGDERKKFPEIIKFLRKFYGGQFKTTILYTVKPHFSDIVYFRTSFLQFSYVFRGTIIISPSILIIFQFFLIIYSYFI